MDRQSAQVVVPFRPQDAVELAGSRDGSLASLAGAPVSGRFCAWRGVSDRRYVATVYPVDRRSADLGLPDFQSFILLAVARSGMSRRVLDVSVVERASSRRAALAAGLACGADEWHVHFLAEDRAARSAMVADLRSRHGGALEARCA